MTKTTDGVILADGETGSGFFHRILSEAVRKFPRALADARLPSDARVFKKRYADGISHFEAARLASDERVAVARFLREQTLRELHFRREGVEQLLVEAFRRDTPAPKTVTRSPAGKAGLVPEVRLGSRTWRGREVKELVGELHAAHHLTNAAAAGLEWVIDFAEAQGGALDLSQERFVLLGASAELSPVTMLLQGGAKVRWVDVKAPTIEPGAGTLVATDGEDDLLSNPLAVSAAVREFAKDGPVHLGLFAYAPGASRELRLAGAMDALVEALGPAVVKSVAFYVSPTSPGELQPEDAEVASGRGRAPKLWQRGLQATRMLRTPGSFGAVARGVISLQGAGYQAAQYLTKIISGEVLATSGLGGRPVTVSANVAGITNTRSLSHPLFQAGFEGAPLFGVRIFEPATTRALAGLLMLHDLLNPNAPGSATRQFDGEVARARFSMNITVGSFIYTQA